MRKNINDGDIVWAKIKGFSSWPGIVGKVIKKENSDGKESLYYLVNFIGQIS